MAPPGSDNQEQLARVVEELRRRLQRCESMVETATDAIHVLDGDGRLVDWNSAFLAHLGYTAQEAARLTVAAWDALFSAQEVPDLIARLITVGGRFETLHRRKDGSICPVEIAAARIEYDGQALLYCSARDITARKAIEAALRESEERWQFAVEGAGDGLWDWNPQTNKVYFSRRWKSMLGYADAEIGDAFAEWDSRVHPEDRERVYAELHRHFAGEASVYVAEHRLRCQDGAYKWILARGKVIRWTPDGKPLRVLGTHTDISQTKAAEAALREGEANLRSVLDAVGDIIVLIDREGRMLLWNQAVEDLSRRLLGALPAGHSLLELMPDELREPRWRRLAEVLQTGRPCEFEDVSRGRDWHNTVYPVRTPDGAIDRVVVHARNITLRKSLEKQLFEARKMEAIGRLAGGVAHEFNNLLTGLLGNVELAELGGDLTGELRDTLVEVRAAAERAADLTRQLLAFSRRQIIQPLPLDLNAAIAGLRGVLRQLLGDGIELRTDLGEKLGLVSMDRGQFGEILLNLAANAREAMPAGGVLTIQTANVELSGRGGADQDAATSGLYVMMALTDSGSGLPPEAQERVFEPFFSAKERNWGTGLELASVYGAVKQNRGHIEVLSTVGRGTSFRLFFPRLAAVTAGRAEAPAGPSGGTETVFLVEPDEAVRRVAGRTLAQAGYRVRSFADPREALAIARAAGGDLDLLLTAIVMPGLNGRELVEQTRLARPGLRALFISAYEREAVDGLPAEEQREDYLAKPFLPRTLLTRVREVLDRPGRPKGA